MTTRRLELRQSHRPWLARPRWALALLACTGLGSLPHAIAHEAEPFKIYVTGPGVYTVDYEDLAPELGDARLAAGSIGLRNRGEPVPIWIDGGEDGFFDPGDSLEFVGHHLPGERSFFNEHTAHNVYWLDFADPAPARMTAVDGSDATARQRGHWSARLRLEEDRLLMRFAAAEGRSVELWYWAKLSYLGRDRFHHALLLPGLDRGSDRPVRLRLGFRGLSQPRLKVDATLRDHRVELSLDGRRIAAAEWDGAEDHLLEAEVPPGLFPADAEGRLSIAVPRRVATANSPGDPLVDVVLLNYIEIDYPHSGAVDAGQTRFRWRPDARGGAARLTAPPGASLVAYTDDGERAIATPIGDAPGSRSAQRPNLSPGQGSDRWLVVVADGALRPPESIELDRPSDLRRTAQQADYLMIVHPRLQQAIEPLASFHRARGLSVRVVEVRDIYDEFNHGILHPAAIRDFIAFAHSRWQPPAPRFVLLVGDASWDSKNETVDPRNYASWTWRPEDGTRIRFGRRPLYDEGSDANDRNLIPAWSVETGEGHAASDNWFVSIDGDDIHPDLAIGRLPVVTPEEVRAIVDKTIRYVERPEVGPWRRHMLWITDENTALQDQSDWITDPLAARGFHIEKVYPDLASVPNEQHQARLKAALAGGQILVHFWGHGGRFIWQTGSTDHRNQRDLFTLDDLDELPPSGRLPVVLSMTCYSGPFDHPNADSIGEKFLRLPDKGAVAVLAASWRSIPTREFSQAVVEELLSSPTIGEAILRAKHQIESPRELIEIYNLLGDPALPLAMPKLSVALEMAEGGTGGRSLVGSVAVDGFGGRAIVEWTSADGALLATRELELEGSAFRVPWLEDETSTARGARVYLWDAATGIDGFGSLSLDPPTDRLDDPALRRP